MNVYDFDNTIYDGESSFDFFQFCLKRHPALIRYFCTIVFHLARYKLCLVTREDMLLLAEKNIFGLMRACPDYPELAEAFWDRNMKKIKPFYRIGKREDDVILTASFDFLIEPCLHRLGIRNAVCSKADFSSGKITRLCFRENKPALFDEFFPGVTVDSFYTDSRNDLAMAKRAEKSFLVRGNRIKPLTFH